MNEFPSRGVCGSLPTHDSIPFGPRNDNRNTVTTWQRFQMSYREFPKLELATDIGCVNLHPAFLESEEAWRLMKPAFAAMAKLEGGAKANPDENRMVGHYWLRNPSRAPTKKIREEIEKAVEQVKTFAKKVHAERLQGSGGPFKRLLVIGIGGSALGPQFVSHALGRPDHDKMRIHFFDNTDPDGMDRVLQEIGDELGQTLCVVISKSGSTPETSNGMFEAMAAYKRNRLDFKRHAVAITGEGSKLHKVAWPEEKRQAKRWLKVFPMWDWVGGRTSETSAVGLLPAALQGLEIDELLRGARECDRATRKPSVPDNPAAILALMWHTLGEGKGSKDMVVIPYKDRLELFSKYLQQLIMESLGKEYDLGGRAVNQGIAVYGNKGSTDQHAYIQQLREGLSNFFAVFIEVLRDREGDSIEVKRGATSGDFLNGFLLGTRRALFEKGRQSVTLTVDKLSAFNIGVLIALFERAVGLYASLININAYHQPGVQAGKDAAGEIIKLQRKILADFALARCSQDKKGRTADRIACDLKVPEEAETVFKICQHLAANKGRGVRRITSAGAADARFAPE